MNLKKNVMLLTVLSLSLGTTTSVFAYSGQKNISVAFNNIKLIVEGKEATSKNGEPFSYNGTTYVPIRTVGEALGKEVSWDSVTSSVIVGGNETTYLDTMPVLQFETASDKSTYESIVIEGGTAVHVVQDIGGLAESDEDIIQLSYVLNNEYKKFITQINNSYTHGGKPSIIKIYGDNQVLYTSPGISEDTKLLDIEVSVQGINTLTIEIITAGIYSPSGNQYFVNKKFDFNNARLIK